MKTTQLILWLLLSIMGPFAHAQQALMDSLYVEYQNSEDPLEQFAIMRRITYLLVKNRPDSAQQLAERNLALAKEAGMDSLLAEAFYDIGVSQQRQSQGSEALASFSQMLGLPILEQYPQLQQKAHQGRGIAYRHLGEYQKAIEAQLEIIRLGEEHGTAPSFRAKAYNNIANIHSDLAEPEKAIEYLQKSLAVWQEIGKPEAIAICYINLGAQAVVLKRNDEAERYLLRGRATFDSIGMQYGVSAANANLGALYLESENYPKARDLYETALEQAREVKDESRIAMALSNLGDVAINQDRHEDAISYLQEALLLAHKTEKASAVKDILSRLAEAQFQSGKAQQAYQTLLKHNVIRDSLFDENVSETVESLKAEFDAERKDQEIKFLTQQRAFDRQQKFYLWGGLGLTVVLLAFNFRSLRASQRANSQLQQERARIESLLKEKESLLQRLSETQQTLVQQEKMASLGKLSAGIAHEINNPVNFISGNASALAMDLQDLRTNLEQGNTAEQEELMTEMQGAIQSLQRGSDRIEQIVSGLKMYSHTSPQGTSFAPQNLNELIDSSLAILNHKLETQQRLISTIVHIGS
ncbi:MAG: tetratricopeptide repeat protein, partial [Bacteroidota bacterium]